MKLLSKQIYIVLIIYILISIFNCCVFALEASDIYSNEALLVNLKNDKVLFSKNTNDGPVPIASITKLMTYTIVVEKINDLENTIIEVPAGTEVKMAELGASTAGLKDGYKYKVIDLLYGLLLPSGCDCADVLSKYVEEKSSTSFVELMNKKAKALGMKDTIYVDPIGLGVSGKNDVSTEQDLYKLVKYNLKKSLFKEIISTEYYYLRGYSGDIEIADYVKNTNALICENSNEKMYYPYSIGGKSGTLSVAGKCLITIAEKGDCEVVAITLGVPGEADYTETYHIMDNRKLLEYAFNELTDNIGIEIGPEFRAMNIGEEITFEARTSGEAKIIWKSSNPKVATIDENGNVKGLSMGRTKITATTSTGNVDYTYLSVGFYNGIHTKYSTGAANSDGGWDPINWNIVKDKGFDYVIIRAGYGAETTDKTFVTNIYNAISKGLKVGIWFEGYAQNSGDALAEANNLIKILEDNFEVLDVKLPIVYSLLYSDLKEPNMLLESTITFSKKMNEIGYKTILELDKETLSNMDLKSLMENDIGLSIIDCQKVPDFSSVMNLNGNSAKIWRFKDGKYLGDEIGTNGNQSLIYMNDFDLKSIKQKIGIKLSSGETNFWSNADEWVIEDITKANAINLIPETLKGLDFTKAIIIAYRAIKYCK